MLLVVHPATANAVMVMEMPRHAARQPYQWEIVTAVTGMVRGVATAMTLPLTQPAGPGHCW